METYDLLMIGILIAAGCVMETTPNIVILAPILKPLADNIGVLAGPAQEDATINEVAIAPGQPSPGGRYYSVYPIQDGTGRLLVSFSQCRLLEIQPDDDMDPMTPPPEPLIVPCT